ncbi:MAG: ComEC/Rec2 family competence protein [Clostridia bacterium]|nr:ComEC/Rec2 family competence protein [Clostridia bacterium]
MKRPFNFRIAPLILLSIILAILSITFCDNSTVLIFVTLAIIALLSVIFIKKFKKARPKLIVCILTFLLFLGLTTLTYIRVENREIYSENSFIEADVDILTECDENGELQIPTDKDIAEICLSNILVDGRKVEGKAIAVFSDPTIFEGYKIGDRIKFRGNIAPQNLVVEDAYSVLDYRNKLYHYIYCNVNFDDENFCFYKVSSGMNLMDRIKIKVKSTLYANTRSDTAGFLYAMTFGDKSGLSSQIKNSFSYTGTAHVFAISGLHIGILAGGILWIFKKTKLNNRVVRLVVMSAVLVIFSALCGFPPSTVRASFMTFLLMLAKALGMRNDGISSMALGASLILLFDPIYLFDIGYLMSFLAVFGILAFYKPIYGLFRKIKIPKKISGLLSTSIAVNILLLPLMMYFFNGETLLFIIANLLLLPVLAVAFPIYILCVTIASVLPFMGWLVTAVAGLFTLLIMLIEWISKIPTLLINFNVNAIIVFIGLLSAVILSKYVFTHKNIKRVAVLVFAVALIFMTTASFRIWGSNNLYVYCFTDKYDCQYVLVDNAFGGEYLIIDEKTSSDSVSSVLNAMSENKFTKIDGIIVVGEVDDYYLDKLQMYTNCPYVYSPNRTGSTSNGIYVGTSVIESGLTIAYINYGTLDIVSGGTTLRILASDYYVSDDNYDILVTYNVISGDTEDKYIVCDIGFDNSIKNCVPSTFTFEINNDKIKVQSSWRY